MLKIVDTNWAWLIENPLGFLAIAAIFFAIGWKFSTNFHKERIEEKSAENRKLKLELDENNKKDTKEKRADTFAYSDRGRHGRNVLSNTTHDVSIGEYLSFQAIVPDCSTLQITLHGPPMTSIGETSLGAWFFSAIGVTNWVHSEYQESTSCPTQHFNAEAGSADMKFHFKRPGKVLIEAFENGTKTASWTKQINII